MIKKRNGKTSKLPFICTICFILLAIIFVITLVVSSKSNKESETIYFELGEYTEQNYELVSGDHKQINFYIYPSKMREEDLEVVNVDETVAKCLIQKMNLVKGKKVIKVSIVPQNLGETTLYLQTKDESVKSDEIHVTVSEKIVEEDNIRPVYLNYEGSKYHFSSSCAGKSSYESTLNQALKLGKEPCSKCVQ